MLDGSGDKVVILIFRHSRVGATERQSLER